MVYFGRHLGSEDKKPVWRKHQDPTIRPVPPSLLQLDVDFEQYFDMFAQDLPDPLGGVLSVGPSAHGVGRGLYHGVGPQKAKNRLSHLQNRFAFGRLKTWLCGVGGYFADTLVIY